MQLECVKCIPKAESGGNAVYPDAYPISGLENQVWTNQATRYRRKMESIHVVLMAQNELSGNTELIAAVYSSFTFRSQLLAMRTAIADQKEAFACYEGTEEEEWNQHVQPSDMLQQ